MTNVYYKQYRHRMNYWPYLSIVCCSHLISLCLRQSVSKHSTSNDKGAAPILWRPKWNRFRWNYINIASAGIIKALKYTDRFLLSFRTSICAMSVISTGNRPEAHLSRYHLVSLALFASCSRNYCYSFLTFFRSHFTRGTECVRPESNSSPVCTGEQNEIERVNERERCAYFDFCGYLLLLSFDVIDSFTINFICFEVQR